MKEHSKVYPMYLGNTCLSLYDKYPSFKTGRPTLTEYGFFFLSSLSLSVTCFLPYLPWKSSVSINVEKVVGNLGGFVQRPPRCTEFHYGVASSSSRFIKLKKSPKANKKHRK